MVSQGVWMIAQPDTWTEKQNIDWSHTLNKILSLRLLMEEEA